MRLTLATLTFLFLSSAAFAAPPVMSGTTATAQGDVRRPVVVEVTVENRGKEPSDPAVATVHFTPKVRGGGGDTLKDPLDLRQQVPPLQPGERKVVTFATPYESRNAFRNQRGTFRAFNIDPAQEIVIEFKGAVAPMPTR